MLLVTCYILSVAQYRLLIIHTARFGEELSRSNLSFSKVLYKMAGLPPQSPMYSEVSESALSGEDTSQFLVAKKVLCGITVTTILKGIKAFVI